MAWGTGKGYPIRDKVISSISRGGRPSFVLYLGGLTSISTGNRGGGRVLCDYSTTWLYL